jgi:hypothetical protein
MRETGTGQKVAQLHDRYMMMMMMMMMMMIMTVGLRRENIGIEWPCVDWGCM